MALRIVPALRCPLRPRPGSEARPGLVAIRLIGIPLGAESPPNLAPYSGPRTAAAPFFVFLVYSAVQVREAYALTGLVSCAGPLFSRRSGTRHKAEDFRSGPPDGGARIASGQPGLPADPGPAASPAPAAGAGAGPLPLVAPSWCAGPVRMAGGGVVPPFVSEGVAAFGSESMPGIGGATAPGAFGPGVGGATAPGVAPVPGPGGKVGRSRGRGRGLAGRGVGRAGPSGDGPGGRSEPRGGAGRAAASGGRRGPMIAVAAVPAIGLAECAERLQARARRDAHARARAVGGRGGRACAGRCGIGRGVGVGEDVTRAVARVRHGLAALGAGHPMPMPIRLTVSPVLIPLRTSPPALVISSALSGALTGRRPR